MSTTEMLKYISATIVIFIFSKSLAQTLDRTQTSNSPSVALGSCIQDPDAKVLQENWRKYHDLKFKKARINISILSEQILMDSETMRFIQAISAVEELTKILDKLEIQFLKKAFVDKRFNDLIASDDFIVKLESSQVDAEIRNSELKFKENPEFFNLLENARTELKRPEIKDALELFKTYDLGILEKSFRKSAKDALKIVRSKGASADVVRSWIQDPPFLRNVPIPASSLGPFALKYRYILTRSIANFVLERKVELAESRKIYRRISVKEVEELNNISPPNEKNAFDDYISKIANAEDAAIDGVARTLWGEATSCQTQGLFQFEAISKIIADRSIAVCRALEEQEQLKTKKIEVHEKNWATFLKNWAGINRPAPGMQNKPSVKLHGLSDFGRKEKSEIPCAAQVISKKNQFSVWNSFALHKYHTGQKHKNIPDAIYEIQGPQNENDDKALVRILCPEFKTEKQIDLWKSATELAQEVVKTPEVLSKRISWPKKGEVLFYTHDAALPFAKEIKQPYLLVNMEKKILRKKRQDPCNKFRLFVPKLANQY